MSFYVDGQSLDDLNVFGKRGRDSIYGLFNVARTRGGSGVLDGMFRYPLSDQELINRRSAIIRYMMDRGIEFPFRGELFDVMEYYLSNTDTRTKLSAHENTLGRKLKGAVGADTEYDQLHKGVLSTIELLDTLGKFVGGMQGGTAGSVPAAAGGSAPKVPAAGGKGGDKSVDGSAASAAGWKGVNAAAAPGEGVRASVGRAVDVGSVPATGGTTTADVTAAGGEKDAAAGAGTGVRIAAAGSKDNASGSATANHNGDGIDNPYRAELDELGELVSDPDFSPLRAEAGAKKLAFAKTAQLDELIRFRLREKLQKILQRIYHLDVYIAVASVAKRHSFAFAHALPGGDNSMDIAGMYHPQVKNAVANSIKVTPEGNVLFLTGANMAGKSTFMKTLGLTVYLAHVGFPVPAQSMEFATLDGMYTTINLPDNLSIGYSHFYAEVMRVKKVAEALGKDKHLLVVFDELFRGTNVKDAYDATVAITEAFAGKRDCLFVISTHIIEAGDALSKMCKNVRFIYLPTIMEGSVARYPYTLAEGITSDRHGMMIINNENVVDIIKKGGRRENHHDAEKFIVDKQTLEDLNMLGEFRPGSIFGLFNRTKTRGGKQMMEDMFRQPLNDAAQINERTAVFVWFQRQGLDFPATREEVDAVEQYLNSGGGSNRVSATFAMGRRKAMQYISRDEEYGLLCGGLDATAAFMRALRDFVRKLDRTGVPATVAPMLAGLDTLFADRRLAWLFAAPRAKTPWYTVASHDYTLRSLLNDQVQQMMKTVYAFDLYTAVAGLAADRSFAYPRALEYNAADSHILVDGFYHPGIPKAVANTISITRDKNVVFLTGANMAGKSTLMKSFSISVYLAHMGFPVAAKEMEFTVQDGMYTSINVSDNLVLGYSHFYAEVVRVKHVAEQVASGKNLVVVFDELFKGTNVKDAYDATVAVTDAFGDHRNCSYIISTHIIEAGHTLTGIKPNLHFVYMPTVMKGAVPTYPYKLTPGITDDRHGMIIIQNEKIIEIINRQQA